MLRKFLHSLVRFLFGTLAHLRVEGLENIPLKGGCILASNHLSRLDPPLVFAIVDREDVTALVADKYQKNPFFHLLIKSVNGIWLNREQADFQALRVARDFLQGGGVLGIAPEGTRSKTGGLIPAKTGVAFLAAKAGVPIVPVAIWGTESAIRRLLSFRRPTIRVRFGKPFTLPSLARQDRNRSLQQNTDEIMERIAALLPPAYRGVYAEHPRLQELLSSREPENERAVA
jgi:1-acyl-sn-glycerol-3-phosphate acyltransferase